MIHTMTSHFLLSVLNVCIPNMQTNTYAVCTSYLKWNHHHHTSIHEQNIATFLYNSTYLRKNQTNVCNEKQGKKILKKSIYFPNVITILNRNK